MIRVLIVDKVRLTSDVFASVLADQPDIEVIGCVTNRSEALEKARDCDVMLVSSKLPKDGAYKLTRALTGSIVRGGKSVTKFDHPVRMVIVGLVESKLSIVRYIEAGALGYVSRDASVEELLTNIRSVYQGKAIISPEITTALIMRLAEFASWFDELNTSPIRDMQLTSREREVLNLIGRNYSNQDIANHLIVEVGTVKNHVHNILSKLNVSNRHEAAAYVAMARDRSRLSSLQRLRSSFDNYIS
jgi:DNA-binding NarL/FixJ family response regulator